MKPMNIKGLHRDYLALLVRFPLRPIRNPREHDAAMEAPAELAVRDEGSLSAGEQDYLDALVVLLEDFDRRSTVPSPGLSGVEALRHLMDANGLTVSDVRRIIGNQPSASLILGGQRAMSKRVIQKLAKHFAVNPGLFLRDEDEAA